MGLTAWTPASTAAPRILDTVAHAVVGKHGLALHHAVPAAVEVTGSFSWDQGGGQEFYPGRPRPHRPNHRGAHCSGTTAH